MVKRAGEGSNPGSPNPAVGGRERSGAKRRRKRLQLLAQRAAKGARRRHRRKNRRYQAFRLLTRNQQEVARRLSVGRVDLVTVTGWSFVASFLAFLDQVEYVVLLDLEGQGFVRVMIPIARLILTYQLKILLGIPSMNLVPTKLFREIALLQLIGYTTVQLQNGFCQRGTLTVGPMHKNTLAEAMEKLTADELATVLNGTAQRLVQHGFFAKSHGHFALDASDLPTTPTSVSPSTAQIGCCVVKTRKNAAISFACTRPAFSLVIWSSRAATMSTSHGNSSSSSFVTRSARS